MQRKRSHAQSMKQSTSGAGDASYCIQSISQAGDFAAILMYNQYPNRSQTCINKVHHKKDFCQEISLKLRLIE